MAVLSVNAAIQVGLYKESLMNLWMYSLAGLGVIAFASIAFILIRQIVRNLLWSLKNRLASGRPVHLRRLYEPGDVITVLQSVRYNGEWHILVGKPGDERWTKLWRVDTMNSDIAPGDYTYYRVLEEGATRNAMDKLVPVPPPEPLAASVFDRTPAGTTTEPYRSPEW